MDNYPYLNQAVSHVVSKLRKSAGYSQQKLAERSSMARVYLLQLEQGKFRPTLNSIFFIARGLGVAPSKFVGMIEDKRRELEKNGDEQSQSSEE